MIDVFVKLAPNGDVLAVSSSPYIENSESWTYVTSGDGTKYRHAQNNFFSKPLYFNNGSCRYKMNEDGTFSENEYEQPPIGNDMFTRMTHVEEALNLLLKEDSNEEESLA